MKQGQYSIFQYETGPGGEDEECLDDGSGEEPEEDQQGSARSDLRVMFKPRMCQVWPKKFPLNFLSNVNIVTYQTATFY